jgi:hypothetical protein
MRGCLSVLVIAALFVLVLAWIGGPMLASTLIERSLAAAGFTASSTSVTVTSEPPVEVLAGHADRVRIDARDAQLETIRAGRLSLALTNVDLLGRRFGSVDGILDDAIITPADGPAVAARVITLRGSAADATATITIGEQVVEQLIVDGIRQQTGLRVDRVTLSAPNRVRFTAGLTLDGRFAVGPNGSLDVVASGDTRFTLLDPPADIHLTSATVVGTDLVVVGTTSLVDLLR